jgi:uncharacterized membrane protein (UPF0182 family)
VAQRISSPLALRRFALVALAALLLAIPAYQSVSLVVDWLWFREVGFTRVMTVELQARGELLLAVAAATALFVAVNLAIARVVQVRGVTSAAAFPPPIGALLDRRFAFLAAGFSLLVGFVMGLIAQGQWRTWLLFAHGKPFGLTDPQFGRDIAFYVFRYPFWRVVIGLAFAVVVVTALAVVFLSYLADGIPSQPSLRGRVSPATIAHLSGLLGLFVMLKAASYYLDRFELLFSFNDVTKTYGASATDIEFLLPAKNILLWIAALSAVVFLLNVGLRRVVPPLMVVVLLGISAVVIGGAVPQVAKQVLIKPNAITREATSITRNIAATRAAFGLTSSATRTDPVTPAGAVDQLHLDTGTLPYTQLLDPSVLPSTFTQLQQVRNFYGFKPVLDVDRYQVGGAARAYVAAVRELDSTRLTGNQTNWINRHTVLTHGYGFVAAPATQVDGRGYPIFVSGSFGAGETEESRAFAAAVPVKQPRIYYGELIRDYAVVGKRSGASDTEFDRPSRSDQEAAQTRTTYSGEGGVPVNTAARRLLFALYFGEKNFLLSKVVHENSRVMFVRNPRVRVEKVAPFLRVDGDPYPAVVNGRILWILDAYTTSNYYPYSQRVALGDAAADAQTGTGSSAQPNDHINYIRNSVKATVDAYDGTVTLYNVDSADPVLAAWNEAFGGLVRPYSEVPPELAAHFRYPADLFKVQRTLLGNYHVANPQEFFNGQDFWKAARVEGQDGAQPPYYHLAQLPGQERATYQVMSPLTANRRESIAALASGFLDPQSRPHLWVWGLPGDSPLPGPNQVQQNMRNDATVRSQLKLLNDMDSRIVYGNLLTLPVGGSLLYVEPIYVQGVAQNAYPALERVLVSYGDKVAYEPTLAQALNSVMAMHAPTSGGATSGQPGATPAPPGQPGAHPGVGPSPHPETGAPASPGSADTAVRAAVAEISKALEALKAAQQRGDFAAIGQAQADLARATSAFHAATAGGGES